MRIVTLILCGIVFASCSRDAGSAPFLAGPPTGAAAVGARLDTSHFKHLFSFAYDTGAFPEAALLNVKGLLYGTTLRGGASNNGTVFTITPSGKQSVLYSFKAGADGASPFAGLTNINGLLYGTTISGGADYTGTVFTITPSGYESVLHTFTSGDGEYPYSSLLDVNGLLYGTTEYGGASDEGTVFTITPSGDESVLYSFKGGSDGAAPFAGLIEVKGVLYGTTYHGGANGDGTVYSITPAGEESVLYSFQGGADGANPYPALLNVNGKLYGTTQNGGASDKGTVFAITPSGSGSESVLYSFTGGTDGANPAAGLLEVKGRLDGTTSKEGGGPTDAGTVFTITTSGDETVLYNFTGSTDGAAPAGTLIELKGKLYGTTLHGGGGSGEGIGTVFRLSP